MATPDQIRRRGRWSLVIGTLLAALALGTVMASGAELVTAELDATVNDVTVEQGTTANFTISLSATGVISAAITSAAPSTARVRTDYSLNSAGSLSSSTLSSSFNFFSSGTGCGGMNCSVTWTGAPTRYTAAASVSADAATPIGTYSIVLSETAGTTVTTDPVVPGGKLDDPAATTITVRVVAPPDSTPPVISYVLTPGSPDGNNDWYKSNVALVWTVTEAESPGSLGKTGCVNQSITADQAATTYSCSATSTGGSAGPVSVTIKRDATAPSAATTLNSLPNGSNDWYTTSPAWRTNGADNLSGLVNDPCATGTYSGPEGTGLTVSGTCTDNAGNTTADDSPPFKYDATGPSAALTVTAGTLGSNGWYTSDVTVDTDGTDGISNPTTCTADAEQTMETAGQVFNGSCTNAAGLTTNADPLTVKLDKTAPSVVYTSQSPVANAAGWNKTDVEATFTATDTLSGFAGPSTTKSGTSTSSGEGVAVPVDSPTFVDLAGNEAAAGAATHSFKIDMTAPSAATTLNSLPNGSNDWYTTSPAWRTNGADNLSGLVNDPCATGTYSGPEGTGLTVSGTCTDNAGNTTADDSPPFKYDATGPSAALTVTAGTLGSNGWYTSDVTVDTDGTDGISNPTTCTADAEQTTETAGQVFNGSCTNAAGLTTNADPLTVKLDKTGPSAALTVTAGTLGGGGWYRSDVTISTTGADAISSPVACDPNQQQTTSTSGQSFNGSCTNNAGLTTNAAPLTVKLDKVNPTLTWTGGPANTGSYYFGSVPAAPTCTTVDPLYSGPASCVVTGYSTMVGSHTMTATAHDVAGNSATETRTYNVLAWTLNGFYQPVDMNNVFNTVKNGSTVPLKFEIFAGSTELTATAAVASLASVQIGCDTSAQQDEVEMVATGGTSLRYDSTGGQFIYNWKTPNTAGKCYRVTMTTQDGSSLVAFFKLK